MPALQKTFLNLADFEKAAQRRLPKALFSYIASAAEDGLCLDSCRRAYESLPLMTKVLVDVSKVDTGVTLFGERYAAPFGIGPMGMAALTAWRGDLVLARAAKAAELPMIMSGSSLIRLEEVAEANPALWFQAYLPGHKDQLDALLQRVKAAGVRVLVITVDTPVTANRETDRRNGFSAPLRPGLGLAWQGITHPRWLFGTFLRTLLQHGMPHFENNYAHRGAPILSAGVLRDFSDRAHLNWEHAAHIRRFWQGPLLIKGILNPEDARQAKELGFDGLVVSNHGGRQLDGAVAPLNVLPQIREAAGPMTVLIDGGIRRGTDILKALALGADAALVARPFGYAATVAGEAGVAHALTLLQNELRRNLQMLGHISLAGIDARIIARAMP